MPGNPVERAYYDNLWAIANPDGSSQLAGPAAVKFFQRSGVDVGVLKQIWSISTPSATMELSQFYVAMRLITMFQNGEIPLSKGKCWRVTIFHAFSIRLSALMSTENVYGVYGGCRCSF